MERTAIFPGSFDPFTRGHAALVEEALNLFDRVVIGIGNNSSKQGLLTVENRKRLIDDVFRNEERVEARIYPRKCPMPCSSTVLQAGLPLSCSSRSVTVFPPRVSVTRSSSPPSCRAPPRKTVERYFF